MTVVPLFCARFIKAPAHHGTPSSEISVTVDHASNKRTLSDRFNIWFNDRFEGFLRIYDRMVGGVLRRPWLTLTVFGVAFAVSLAMFPLLGLSFFPRTDAGQFVINLKAPAGTRLSVTENEVAKVEDSGTAGGVSGRPGNDRLEYRRDARFFGDLHHQLGDAHGVRAGEPERGAQDRQLRVHGAGQAADRSASCRN